MAKYIMLANWTDNGIKNVKHTTDRLDAARLLAKDLGCMMKDFYLTMGIYDMVVIVEAPDNEAMAKLALSIARGGNVRTVTMSAQTEASYRNIVGSL